MSDHVFGKPLSRTFVAYENDVAIDLTSINSVKLYSSLSDATSALSPIVTMSSWTAVGTTRATYNLPAVSDPNPTSDRRSWQLWEAIKYRLSSGGDVQTEYRSIDVSRAIVGDSVPGTTKEDLKALFPALASYLSDARIDDILDLAGLRMKLDLKANGVEYGKARNLWETKLALAFLAISMNADALYLKTNQDAFRERAKDYEQKYTDALKKIALPYDGNADGEVDQVKQAQPTFRYMPR